MSGLPLPAFTLKVPSAICRAATIALLDTEAQILEGRSRETLWTLKACVTYLRGNGQAIAGKTILETLIDERTDPSDRVALPSWQAILPL